MGTIQKRYVGKKPKLPRKRKKALIDKCGRKKYYDTIALAKATEEFYCKFWKEVSNETCLIYGAPIVMPVPKSFW